MYVYGIVPSVLDMSGAPAGIDEGAVQLEPAGDLGALVSPVDAAVYASGVDDRVGDLAWLGPRAIAHDRVTSWASELGAVVPLPMFSLFHDDARVRQMLRTRHDELAALLARVAPGREYALRVFRLDDVLHEALARVSPRVAALEREAEAAPPGQRYLLTRKLDGVRRDEAREVSETVARTVYETLAARALAAVADPLPSTVDGAAGTAVLNASFLVGRNALTPFREALTEMVRQHDPSGFRFEFTGPWPPYHFARSDANG